MKILSAELEGGVTVQYLPKTILIMQGAQAVELTDAQLKVIRDTIRGNKSNGIVESKEKEK